MIRYQLRCGKGHGFEGWFKNSDAYSREVEALDCPICGDRSIEKAIMAPAVLQRAAPAGPPAEPAATAAGGAGPAPVPAASAPADSTAPVPAVAPPPLAPEQVQLAKAMLVMRQLRAHVEANFENVGKRFAEEARKIHYHETEERGIYGEASRDEVEALEDEGISVVPLPVLPKLDG